MITVLKPNTTKEQQEQLINWFKKQNLDVHISVGDNYTVLGLIGDTTHIDMDLVDDIEKLNKEAEKNGKLYSMLHTGRTYMTCVTCEYTNKNGRLLVIGERIRHMKRPDAS